MSRCIPFPPPGYVWNGVGGEALIELIKVNRERLKAEKEKKKNKEKKKRREDGEVMREIQSRKSRHKDDKNKRSREKSDNQKNRKYEVPRLENSSLSERSSKPVCSTPRWMDQLVQEDFEMALRPNKDQFYSTLGMSTALAEEMASGPTRERCHSSSRIEVVADENAETAPASTFSGSGLMQIESQYRTLIVNWIPPPLQTKHPKFDDQEWLFQRRQHISDMTREINAYNDDFCHGSTVPYPSAQYLSKADICALPFAISF